MKRALARRSLPLSSAVSKGVRDIERVQERERERLRVCVSEAHWMQRTGCWSAPPPLKIHFKTRLKETGRRARHERRDVTVATYQ